MSKLEINRCTRPTLTRRAISTYTVLGFAGYIVASAVGSALAVAWELTMAERLIGLLAPPLAFLAAVLAARAVVGQERIVFYQAASGAVIATASIAAIAGAHVARLVDLATVGIGIFLVFGRMGCFAVACCHGLPGPPGRGVVYGAAHVRLGFWARWEGRSLWPVQLVESAASGILVLAALVGGAASPGTAAVIYIVGYGVLRFFLELARGDSARPHLRGTSEAQWFAVLSVAACAVWRPSPLTAGAAVVLAAAMAVLVARVRHRELFLPPHLRELDDCCTRILGDPARGRQETSLGVALSCHDLPDGRRDWVLSSRHAVWSLASARRMATLLWREAEVLEGRTPGIIHVVIPGQRPPAPDPAVSAAL